MEHWKSPIVLLVVGLLLSAPGCRHTSDEQQVREAIAAVVAAAQVGDARAVVASIEDDFAGNNGVLDRSGLRNLVRVQALRQSSIGVHTGPVTIATRGSRIVANFGVSLTAGGRVIPDQLSVYQVETAWRKDSGAWRCYNATWKRLR